MIKSGFTTKLLRWNKKENKRSMPWKGEKDPYKIWLSEIILQQTRVEQGWNYYERFVAAFPTVRALAKTPDQKIFKLWEGLGYYNRCKNLIETARSITDRFKGRFPSTYEEIIRLKGIGPYTAAAIASFAFDLPYAVVDANVERVISRYFGITTAVDTASGKKFYKELAGALLDKKQAALYNQSIMDFGAIICKPKKPLCVSCVQNRECQAYLRDMVLELPVQKKAIKKKKRWLTYFIIGVGDAVYIRQRRQSDIWENLYEFVLLETDYQPLKQEMPESSFLKNLFGKKKFKVKNSSPVYKQELSHQTIFGQFINIETYNKNLLLKGYLLVKKKDIGLYPFPGFVAAFLQQFGNREW
jgi:A/G-specific adenine glycosylase